MKFFALLLTAGCLAACQNPDFTLGATISGNGIQPSVSASSDNVAVVVRP